MSLIKELAKWFVVSATVTLGACTAKSAWESGLGERIDARARKIFTKK